MCQTSMYIDKDCKYSFLKDIFSLTRTHRSLSYQLIQVPWPRQKFFFAHYNWSTTVRVADPVLTPGRDFFHSVAVLRNTMSVCPLFRPQLLNQKKKALHILHIKESLVKILIFYLQIGFCTQDLIKYRTFESVFGKSLNSHSIHFSNFFY